MARETVTWNTMPVPERVGLCQLAGLPGKLGSRSWGAIEPQDQLALIRVIEIHIGPIRRRIGGS